MEIAELHEVHAWLVFQNVEENEESAIIAHCEKFGFIGLGRCVHLVAY